MIYEVEVSEQADSDLRGIFEYIALNEKLTSTFSLFCSTLGTGGGS